MCNGTCTFCCIPRWRSALTWTQTSWPHCHHYLGTSGRSTEELNRQLCSQFGCAWVEQKVIKVHIHVHVYCVSSSQTIYNYVHAYTCTSSVCIQYYPLPSFLDNGNDWSLISKSVRGHPFTDLRGLENPSCSCCFSLTILGVELLGISSRLRSEYVFVLDNLCTTRSIWAAWTYASGTIDTIFHILEFCTCTTCWKAGRGPWIRLMDVYIHLLRSYMYLNSTCNSIPVESSLQYTCSKAHNCNLNSQHLFSPLYIHVHVRLS